MDVKRKYSDLLGDSWGDRLKAEESSSPNELYLTLLPEFVRNLADICSTIMKTFHAHFVTLIPVDELAGNGTLSVLYVFSVPSDDLFLILRVPVDPRYMELPSITTHVDAANWFEREMKDWFGVIAFPNIAKLASHPDWPEDVHPLLKSFDIHQAVPRVRGDFDFKRVEGEGIFEIPVGPVHAGIIEPRHFRFSVAGEPIINLDAQLFYTHKATEKIAEGLTPEKAVFLAERISGDSAFGHALAFCHAVERLSGIEVPREAVLCRTILLELERMYNHIGDIGAIMQDVGFAVGAAASSRLKEECLQANEVLTGSRLLHSVAAIGGIRRNIRETTLKRETLHRLVLSGRKSFEAVIDLIKSSSSAIDRLETTGVLSRESAHRLGVVGVAGRASGIDRDLRRDHPHCAYRHLRFKSALYEEGDVFARFNVRVDEIRQSFDLLGQLEEGTSGEDLRNSSIQIAVKNHALGYVEGWRGEIVHWVMTDANGLIYRWKITDPSFHNWRALTVAVLNNIIPDFPVINKSFNLSYSGNDR